MFISIVFLFCVNAAVVPQNSEPPLTRQARSAERSSLTGVYRIDIPASDKLYSVVANAAGNVPSGEQQRFFIDLAARLTPPDLLAIEQRGSRISLGSSRAPKMTFEADGIAHSTRGADGRLVQVRFALENIGKSKRLVFTSTGSTEDNFSVVFESMDNGRRLLVVRRITGQGLDQPLVIQTFYNRVSDVARWELYGETPVASSTSQYPTALTPDRSVPAAPPAGTEPHTANVLRNALNEWIAATNNRDIDRQMTFYVPRLRAYYLTRDTPQSFVRVEKARVFAKATLIDIRAAEPEIIFQDGGQTAIMRYRKKYRVDSGRLSRRGEVIQELRWQRIDQVWRIFSERDIRVLRGARS